MLTKQNKKLAFIIIINIFLLCITNQDRISNSFASTTSSVHNLPTLSSEREDWWWAQYELLTADSTSNSYQPSFAIDSNDNIHVVWHDSTNDLAGSGSDTDVFYIYYDSAIKDWSSIEVVSSVSTLSSNDPVLDVDNEGNIHVAWIDVTDYMGSGADWDVFYRKRTPTGTWTTTTVVTTASTGFVSNVDLKTDHNNNIHFVWYDNTNMLGAGTDADIFYTWYNSSLASWSSTYLVSTESTSGSAAPTIETDSISGSVYIAWYDYTNLLSCGTDIDIFYKSFDHSSLALTSLIIISDESTDTSSTPNLVSNSKGELHIFWVDYTDIYGAGTDSDMFHKHLDSSSGNWVGFETVSTESTRGSFDPDSVCDKEDRIFLVWYDSTDIDGSGTDYDIFFKFKNPSSSIWSDLYIVSTGSDDPTSSPKVAVDSNGFVSCIWRENSNILGAGTDPDIFYRKFVGTPDTPLLSQIIPNPSPLGSIELNWKEDTYVTSYSLYRDSSFIWTTTDMTPIATVTSNNYTDILTETGVYYYGVVANNEYGGSALSNIEHVQIVGKFLGSFNSLGVLEILTLIGGVIISQIVISLLVNAFISSRNKGRKTKGSGKKKKK